MNYFINGCKISDEKKDVLLPESTAKKKKENKLCKLLAELVETERKYVENLEEVKMIPSFPGK